MIHTLGEVKMQAICLAGYGGFIIFASKNNTYI